METGTKKQPLALRPEMPHKITLSQRHELHLTGVKEVLHFDEESVLLDTTGGRLNVRGSELKIGSLNTENGELKLTGNMDVLAYLAGGEKKGLRRLFG